MYIFLSLQTFSFLVLCQYYKGETVTNNDKLASRLTFFTGTLKALFINFIQFLMIKQLTIFKRYYFDVLNKEIV